MNPWAARLPTRTLGVAACGLALAACGGGQPATRRSTGRAAPPRHSLNALRPRAQRAPRPLVFHPLFSLGAPVQDPASAPLGRDRFVLLGGLTAADTSTDNVIVGDATGAALRASLPNAQHDAQAAALGGRVFVFGGGQFSEYDHILAFDPGSGAVQASGALPTAASDAAVAGDGRTAYVVGGFDGANWLDTVLAYAPGGAPHVIARLPVGLRYAAAVAVAGRIIVAGGTTPSGISDAVYRVDPATGTVSLLTRLPAGIAHAAAGVISGTMYLVGGHGELESDRSSQIWAIDPATGALRRAGTLPQPLSDEAVISLGDHLIVAGGSTAGGTQALVGELVPGGA
jgi:outer membrane protein assembly factor BamB